MMDGTNKKEKKKVKNEVHPDSSIRLLFFHGLSVSLPPRSGAAFTAGMFDVCIDSWKKQILHYFQATFLQKLGAFLKGLLYLPASKFIRRRFEVVCKITPTGSTLQLKKHHTNSIQFIRGDLGCIF